MPTAEDIFRFLRSLRFNKGTPPRGWHEEVYVKAFKDLGILIQIGTTVDRRTGLVRELGTDAFRYQIWSIDQSQILKDLGSTRRRGDWRKNMREKIGIIVHEYIQTHRRLLEHQESTR